MRNQAPIFLNCLSRGGSNIFWNIFLSHPDACSPIYETLEIFRTDWRSPRWQGVYVALRSGQPHLFNQWHLEPRPPVPERVRRFIDRTLYEHKLRTYTDREMRFKTEGQAYTMAEVEQARLVTKNNNGLAFLSDLFTEMYPDASFFALLRDPIPLYESHRRRRITRSPPEFAEFYNQLAARAIADQERLRNFHIIRFEDILARPKAMICDLYEKAGLDPAKTSRVRFRAKPHYRRDGTHGTTLPALGHYWFDLDRVYEILEPEINRLQGELVPPVEREQVADLTRAFREHFGYA